MDISLEEKKTDITKPCQLCREESIGASGGRYCARCYIELITNFYIGKYPISSRELEKRLKCSKN